MDIHTVVEDLPEDHDGPDPSRGETITIHLPRCRRCGKVLNQPRRRFCNTRCKQTFKNERTKLKISS